MPRQPRWKNFSDEELKQIISESYSDREVALKLGYAVDGGGTMASIHKMYQQIKADTSHFKGQGWNKNNYNYDVFTVNSYKKNGKTTRDALIYLRGMKCEKCGITEWLGQPINLEVHHINGDRTDNRLENLQLLCPNCHSYTPNFSQSGSKRQKTEEEFVQALNGSHSIHQALQFLDLTPSAGNYDRAYKLIYKYDISHLKEKTKEHQDEKSLE